MRIGIIGGTFNPIHNGHIDIALRILELFFLDKILFMPNNIPPHKNIEELLDKFIRLEMINISIDGYANLEVEEFELNQNKISYTYESLEYLKKIYDKDELFFIMGSDEFLNFDKWKNIDRIFKNVSIIVYLRNDFDRDEIVKLKSKYEMLYDGKIFLFFGKIIKISSTDIRAKLIDGNDVSNLIPKPLYDYIILKNLYRR